MPACHRSIWTEVGQCDNVLEGRVHGDAFLYGSYGKVIYDRAGKYWKSMLAAFSGYESPDKTMQLTFISHGVMVDERTQHVTGDALTSPRTLETFFARVNMRDFTLAGFQKYCR